MFDDLDRKIIVELSKDGRLPFVELAEKLQVTETTIRKRVKQLLASGTIHIRAVPDLESMGYKFIAVVGLQIRLADLKHVAMELIQHPNICYAINVTGRFDFLIIVVTRSSREFADIIENVVSVIPGMIRTETFVNLNIYKGKITGLDTEQLLRVMDIKKRWYPDEPNSKV